MRFEQRALIPFLLTLSVAALCGRGTPAFAGPSSPTAGDAETTARAFLDHLGRAEFQEARALFDETMTKAMAEGQLASFWRGLVAKAGKLEAQGPARIQAAGAFRVADVPLTFERAVVTLRVTVDVDKKVAGLFVIDSKPRREAASNAVLETPTGTLYGTLALPAGEGPFPAVVFVAGSGPTDRDGNAPGAENDSLKLLAQALVDRGIAVLRYDKRGIGESAKAMTAEKDLRFDMLVHDAAAWVAWLRRQPKIRDVGLVGHSEGALVAALAAPEAKAAAYVSLEGTSQKAKDLLLRQLQEASPDLQQQAHRILDALEAGKDVPDVPHALDALFRPSVQPYLRSWMAKDPLAAVAALTMPVLFVGGTTDIQVPAADAAALAKARPGARLLVVDGMNHVLKPARTDAEQARAYQDPTVALEPTLATQVADFLRSALAPR